MRMCVCCGKASSQHCGGCGNVSYCGVKHQREHWTSHKAACRPTKVESSPSLGNYLVAARDLNPGDLILDEPVSVLGPPTDCKVSLCLGCYFPVNSYRCDGCGTPLCGPTCQTNNHPEEECWLLSESGLGRKLEHQPALYGIITPLRLIQLKISDPGRYKKCMALSTNLEARLGHPDMEVTRNTARKLVEEVSGLGEDLTMEKVVKILARLDTNTFQVLAQGCGVDLCGLYTRVALINHNCVQNCRMVFRKDYTMQVFASVPISKGSPINISYTPPFHTTFTRRNILFRGKQFYCMCPRCTDPTELGSYCSAVCCPTTPSCNGYLLPSNPTSTVPSPWQCNKCGLVEPAEEAAAREVSLFKEQAGMSKDKVEELKALLENFEDKLHPFHGLLTETRQNLTAALGRAEGYSYDRLSIEDLTLKKELCLSLLTVCNLLEPGLSKSRGITLLELSEAIARISNKKVAKEEINVLEHLEDMYEAERRLDEAHGILRMEDEEALEGGVAKVARNQLAMVRGYIRDIENKVKDVVDNDGNSKHKWHL